MTHSIRQIQTFNVVQSNNNNYNNNKNCRTFRPKRKKEKEKIDKYQELKLEIMRMWSGKAWVVPIVVGALGCTTKKLEDNLKSIRLPRINSSLQMSALLGTANILRKTLDI